MAIALIGCDASLRPSTPDPTGTPAVPSLAPVASDSASASDPAPVVADQLAGPWQANPALVDDARTAIASDACAAEARTTLGDTEANLPTSMIDARGEGLVLVIMADDLNAILCLAHLGDAGAAATVDSVDRLSKSATAPVDGSAISVAAFVQLDDRAGGRTIAFGRLGPAATGATVGFGDRSVVRASTGDGWWATWWPGTVRATSFSAVDGGGLVVGSTKPPAGQLEARTSRAAWWLDPVAERPTAASTAIHALILEAACASGTSPDGRIEEPSIDLEATTVTVTIDVRHRVGGQDCQGNAPVPYTITLPEPLGARSLLDGSTTPPRDATTVPSG